MGDFLDEKLKEIQGRLKELKPLVDEYHRLEAAERALAGSRSPPATAAAKPAAGAARVASSSSPAAAAARADPVHGPLRRSQLVGDGPASRSPSSPIRWGSSRPTCTA